MRKDGVWDADRRNAKVLTAPLKTGDAYALRSGGGGGFGSPLERAPEAVREDVHEGYVSLAAARDYYGVVLDAMTLEIDAAATAAERAGLTEVHRRRMMDQGLPLRRLTAAELSERGAEHPPVPCLQISCCGRISFPFLDGTETP
jgi:hypothetical protein